MQSQSRDEDDQVYQQNQVIWAKIKGYPWWPAFIIEINGQTQNQQMEYTVLFFGDNTHSRLGQSKIRKFINKYQQFYQKAKQNRKLKMSIMKAQEKLQQNGENISIFQTLRNSMKNSKKKKGCQSVSKKDSSQHYELHQSPQLIKNKTFDAKLSKNISQSEIYQKSSKFNINSIQKESIQQIHLSHPISIEKNYSQVQISKSTLRRSQRGTRKVQPIPQRQPSSSHSQQKDKSQQEEHYPNKRLNKKKLQEKNQKIQKSLTLHPSKKAKGKSRFQQQLINQQQSANLLQQDQPDQIVQKKSKPNKVVRKLSKKKRLFKTKNQVDHVLTISPQNKIILQRIQFCLRNRDELIQTLSNISITVSNVKQILDLGVTNILRDGQITNQVRYILETLKAIILYKYFPGDGKIKKKYQKAIKKRKVAEKVQIKQNIFSNSVDNLEIRKKTTIKLENILKPYVHNQAIEYATKIESFFRQRDQTIGQEYKKLAYMILRSLKDKISTVDEVISKLENDQYE